MTIRSWFFHLGDLLWRTYQHFFMTVKPDYFLFNVSNHTASAITYRPSEAVVLRDVINAENAFVKTIKWCKGKALPYHEFLLFHVVEVSSRRRETFIVVERGVSSDKIKLEELGSKDSAPEELLNAEGATADCDGIDAEVRAKAAKMEGTPPTPPARSSPVPPSSSSSSIPSSSSSSIARKSLSVLSSSSELSSSLFGCLMNSDDRLTFSQYKLGSMDFIAHRNYDVLYVLEVQIGAFNVPRLAVLVDVVHRYYPRYTAWAYQCYWFAKAIYTTVTYKCRMEKMGTQEAVNQRAYRCGKFGKIPIPRGDNRSEQGILDRFDLAWGRHCSLIQMYKEHEETERRMEIKEATAEVRERAKQAEERAEQAEERAEQEHEARRQAEKLAKQEHEARKQEHEARREAERSLAAAKEELRRMKAAAAKK